MSTSNTAGGALILPLRLRESATQAMIWHIDDKLARLNSARIERVAALNHIRCEFARVRAAEQAASDRHEHRA